MQEITIKIKSEGKTFSKKEFKPDTFDTSKANPNMQNIIEQTLKEVNLDPVDSVKTTVKTEW
jgi:hypothetical protein